MIGGRLCAVGLPLVPHDALYAVTLLELRKYVVYAEPNVLHELQSQRMAAARRGSGKPVGIGTPPQVARTVAARVDGSAAAALLYDIKTLLQGFLNQMIYNGVESTTRRRVVVCIRHVGRHLPAEHLPGLFRAVGIAPIAETASAFVHIVANVLWHRAGGRTAVGIALATHQEDLAGSKGITGLQAAADKAVTLRILVSQNNKPFVFVREERLALNQITVAIGFSTKIDLPGAVERQRQLVLAQRLTPDVRVLSARQQIAQLTTRLRRVRYPVLLHPLRVGGTRV